MREAITSSNSRQKHPRVGTMSMGRPAAISAAREETVDQTVARELGTPVAQSAIAGLPALVVAPDGKLKFCTSQSAPLRDGESLKPIIRQHVAGTLESGTAQLV